MRKGTAILMSLLLLTALMAVAGCSSSSSSDDAVVVPPAPPTGPDAAYAGSGNDASWDQGGEMLHSDELPDRDSTIDAPAGEREVQYALISADMEEGTALKQWETAEPLDGEAREKYDQGMWKVFDNGEVAIYCWPA